VPDELPKDSDNPEAFIETNHAQVPVQLRSSPMNQSVSVASHASAVSASQSTNPFVQASADQGPSVPLRYTKEWWADPSPLPTVIHQPADAYPNAVPLDPAKEETYIDSY